jgi:hypothetical protein
MLQGARAQLYTPVSCCPLCRNVCCTTERASSIMETVQRRLCKSADEAAKLRMTQYCAGAGLLGAAAGADA